MNENEEKYYSLLNDLYEIIGYIIGGNKRKIIENKIEEIMILSDMFLGEDNEKDEWNSKIWWKWQHN